MTIIITGAASGIGRAVALQLANMPGRKEAVSLTLVDRDGAALETLAKELREAGADVLALAADLADAEAPKVVVAAAMERFRRIDSVVSNAGVAANVMLMEMPIEEYDRVFAINTRACWLLAKAAYPHLKKTGGSLVATASISGVHATATLGAYSPSKAALLMLIRQMADEWGPDGLRCNAVSPGMVHTGMTARAYTDDALRARRAEMVPLRRIAQPEDIARVIVFLLGPDASYMNGADVVVDGGLGNAFMGNSRKGMVL